MDEQNITRVQNLLPKLDPAFKRGAFILHHGSPYLTGEFWRLVHGITEPGTIACYSPILDVLAADSLRYHREPGQRCFCMFMRASTHDFNLVLAAAIHEGAHYLTDRHQSRDEPDQAKAIANWWKNRPRDINSHSRSWLRGVVHLWHRACRLGCELPLSTFGLEQYDYGVKDWGPLLDEASEKEDVALV